MKPIDWTDDDVRLQCPDCGEAADIGARAYFWALGRGIEIGCPQCGGESALEDRRQTPVPVERDRRVAAGR
jgi:predicted RNA-binding Zn-ribbon protein involved in translation (DUF1610 family)